MEGFAAFNAFRHKNLSYWMESRLCEGTQTLGFRPTGMHDGRHKNGRNGKQAACNILSVR